VRIASERCLRFPFLSWFIEPPSSTHGLCKPCRHPRLEPLLHRPCAPSRFFPACRYEDEGKLLTKRNTFTDFIACADHLVGSGWTAKKRVAAQGGSAGGLLMGVIANERPDLWAAVLAEVPFVGACALLLHCGSRDVGCDALCAAMRIHAGLASAVSQRVPCPSLYRVPACTSIRRESQRPVQPPLFCLASAHPHFRSPAYVWLCFADVLATMVDSTIPLTTTEWEEWGNPNEREYYEVRETMGRWSPCCLGFRALSFSTRQRWLVHTGLRQTYVFFTPPPRSVAAASPSRLVLAVHRLLQPGGQRAQAGVRAHPAGGWPQRLPRRVLGGCQVCAGECDRWTGCASVAG
jgi:hypothetical protein